MVNDLSATEAEVLNHIALSRVRGKVVMTSGPVAVYRVADSWHGELVREMPSMRIVAKASELAAALCDASVSQLWIDAASLLNELDLWHEIQGHRDAKEIFWAE